VNIGAGASFPAKRKRFRCDRAQKKALQVLQHNVACFFSAEPFVWGKLRIDFGTGAAE